MASLLVQALTTNRFEAITVSNVVDAVTAVAEFDPDAVVIDIDLGDGPTGLDLALRLQIEHPDVATIFLTKYPDPSAAGQGDVRVPPGSVYLDKDAIFEIPTLVAGIEAALQGEPGGWRHDLHPTGPLAALTRAQREVLHLAALGYTNAAIARRRGTGERAVELLLHSALQSLGVPSRDDLNPRAVAIRTYIELAGVPTGPIPPP